eukprot:364472-Chlamydomonas_euryale.AAC.7
MPTDLGYGAGAGGRLNLVTRVEEDGSFCRSLPLRPSFLARQRLDETHHAAASAASQTYARPLPQGKSAFVALQVGVDCHDVRASPAPSPAPSAAERVQPVDGRSAQRAARWSRDVHPSGARLQG